MKYYDMKLLCSECGHETTIKAEAIERRWNSIESTLGVESTRLKRKEIKGRLKEIMKSTTESCEYDRLIKQLIEEI
jgi:hypothetical protein